MRWWMLVLPGLVLFGGSLFWMFASFEPGGRIRSDTKECRAAVDTALQELFTRNGLPVSISSGDFETLYLGESLTKEGRRDGVSLEFHFGVHADCQIELFRTGAGGSTWGHFDSIAAGEDCKCLP